MKLICMRNNKRALYESIMKQVSSVVYNSINEMDWEGIKDKLDKDKRPYAIRIGKKVGDYMQSDAYSKNYSQKKYVPKTKEELIRYVEFEIDQQGGVNVDLNMIDTRYITDMSELFYGCSRLQTLDVRGWDTSNMKDMSSMFEYCSSLQILDVSGWDTSKVENMKSMFRDCESLQTIDVSNWDTSKVEKMKSMFRDCKNLETLAVSGWDTSKVKDMSNMFFGCRKLKADISMWKIVYYCNTIHMLKGARNIICTWDNAEELMENKRYNRR